MTQKYAEWHDTLDKISAEWIMETRGKPSRNTVLDLMKWLYYKKTDPDAAAESCVATREEPDPDKSGPRLPMVKAIILCESIIIDLLTHKRTLVGVFESVKAPYFPVVLGSMSVYVKMTEAQGKYEFTVELLDLAEDKVIGRGALPGHLEADGPLQTGELNFIIYGVRFNHGGRYEFQVKANGRLLAHKSFQVNSVDSEEEGEAGYEI